MFESFKWFNECPAVIDNDSICMTVRNNTDMFNKRDGITVSEDAAFFYTELDGDCIIRALVTVERKGTYDSSGLMIYSDRKHWIKGCLELMPNGKTSAVSVTTNGISDDAVGPYIDNDTVWLQVSRAGNTFAVHFSTDGENFDLIRICRLDVPKTIKIGLLGQAPTGEGGKRIFKNIKIYNKTITDIKSGII